MINCKIVRDKSHYRSVDITGHSGFGEHGSDIVCSAVSILVFSLVNTIEKVAGIKDSQIDIVLNSGELKLRLGSQANSTSDILIAYFEEGIRGIEEKYPNNLKLEIGGNNVNT